MEELQIVETPCLHSCLASHASACGVVAAYLWLLLCIVLVFGYVVAQMPQAFATQATV